MAFKNCNYGKSYRTKSECAKACGPNEVPKSCDFCRGYHPKGKKRKR